MSVFEVFESIMFGWLAFVMAAVVAAPTVIVFYALIDFIDERRRR